MAMNSRTPTSGSVRQTNEMPPRAATGSRGVADPAPGRGAFERSFDASRPLFSHARSKPRACLRIGFFAELVFCKRQDNDTAKGLNTLLFARPVGNKYEIRGCRGIAPYDSIRRSLSALPTTLTEDNAMAAAAITGERRMPNAG